MKTGIANQDLFIHLGSGALFRTDDMCFVPAGNAVGAVEPGGGRSSKGEDLPVHVREFCKPWHPFKLDTGRRAIPLGLGEKWKAFQKWFAKADESDLRAFVATLTGLSGKDDAAEVTANGSSEATAEAVDVHALVGSAEKPPTLKALSKATGLSEQDLTVLIEADVTLAFDGSRYNRVLLVEESVEATGPEGQSEVAVPDEAVSAAPQVDAEAVLRLVRGSEEGLGTGDLALALGIDAQVLADALEALPIELDDEGLWRVAA